MSRKNMSVYHMKNPEDILTKIRDVAYQDMDGDKRIELIRTLLG